MINDYNHISLTQYEAFKYTSIAKNGNAKVLKYDTGSVGQYIQEWHVDCYHRT